MKKSAFMITAIVVLAAAALIFGLIPGLGLSAREQEISLGADGKAMVGMAGDRDGDSFLLSTAAIQVTASDTYDDEGKADHLVIDADISEGWREYRLRVRRAMPADPLGRFNTGGGVRENVNLGELDGGSSWYPPSQMAPFAAFGYGDVTCHGELVGMGLPVRVFTLDAADAGLPMGARLVLDIGDESFGLIQGEADTRKGVLRVLWPDYQAGFQPIPITDETGICS